MKNVFQLSLIFVLTVTALGGVSHAAEVTQNNEAKIYEKLWPKDTKIQVLGKENFENAGVKDVKHLLQILKNDWETIVSLYNRKKGSQKNSCLEQCIKKVNQHLFCLRSFCRIHQIASNEEAFNSNIESFFKNILEKVEQSSYLSQEDKPFFEKFLRWKWVRETIVEGMLRAIEAEPDISIGYTPQNVHGVCKKDEKVKKTISRNRTHKPIEIANIFIKKSNEFHEKNKKIITLKTYLGELFNVCVRAGKKEASTFMMHDIDFLLKFFKGVDYWGCLEGEKFFVSIPQIIQGKNFVFNDFWENFKHIVRMKKKIAEKKLISNGIFNRQKTVKNAPTTQGCLSINSALRRQTVPSKPLLKKPHMQGNLQTLCPDDSLSQAVSLPTTDRDFSFFGEQQDDIVFTKELDSKNDCFYMEENKEGGLNESFEIDFSEYMERVSDNEEMDPILISGKTDCFEEVYEERVNTETTPGMKVQGAVEIYSTMSADDLGSDSSVKTGSVYEKIQNSNIGCLITPSTVQVKTSHAIAAEQVAEIIMKSARKAVECEIEIMKLSTPSKPPTFTSDFKTQPPTSIKMQENSRTKGNVSLKKKQNHYEEKILLDTRLKQERNSKIIKIFESDAKERGLKKTKETEQLSSKSSSSFVTLKGGDSAGKREGKVVVPFDVEIAKRTQETLKIKNTQSINSKIEFKDQDENSCDSKTPSKDGKVLGAFSCATPNQLLSHPQIDTTESLLLQDSIIQSIDKKPEKKPRTRASLGEIKTRIKAGNFSAAQHENAQCDEYIDRILELRKQKKIVVANLGVKKHDLELSTTVGQLALNIADKNVLESGENFADCLPILITCNDDDKKNLSEFMAQDKKYNNLFRYAVVPNASNGHEKQTYRRLKGEWSESSTDED